MVGTSWPLRCGALAMAILGACAPIKQAEPGWLMRYAEADLVDAPLGRLESLDLTWTVLGLELVPAGERARWVGAVGRGLRGWEGIEAVPIRLSYAHEDDGADVRVVLDDGWWAADELALGWPPASDSPGLILIRYDDFGRDIWTTGNALIGTPLSAPSRMVHRPTFPSLGLVYTARHEMGHVLGIDHLGDPRTLMSGATRNVQLDVGDVAAVVAIYWEGAAEWRRTVWADRWGRFPKMTEDGGRRTER
jgi:hypothetical protein